MDIIIKHLFLTVITPHSVQLTLMQLLRWSLQSLMHGRGGTEMSCAAFYQRRRNTNSKLLLTTFSKTICDRKRCLKYVVVGNPRLKDGNWLNQRLTNWIRKCAKVGKRDEWYAMLPHYDVCWPICLFFCKMVLIVCFTLLKTSAETEPHEGKRKTESMWPIFRYSSISKRSFK